MVYLTGIITCIFAILSAGTCHHASTRLHPTPLNAHMDKQIISFPGAMGGGMYTTGGRGGKVIKVTNLNDCGPGSLRDAINTPGSRTIIFDVSGTIELNAPILVEHGNLTLAGQTAPGGGICIKGHEFRISAENIIIRFVRFRPGDIAGEEYDAITAIGNKDIIIDHCSMSWSTDETASFYDNENFTMQWCLISESLNNSVHSKGVHGYGGIWGGKNASFIFNILAHHNSRNPRLQGARNHEDSAREKTEVLYNIIYNWGDKAIYGGENGRYNIQYNMFIPGPATTSSASQEILEPYKPYGAFYLSNNMMEGSSEISNNNWLAVSIPEIELTTIQANKPFFFKDNVTQDDPAIVYQSIIQYAGASLPRDAVDKRIIRELTERSYSYGNQGIIDSQDETGGWPVLHSAQAPLDSDGDGIPDAWELLHGLDPGNPLDGNEYTLDPHYTNLEMYLNDLLR